MCVDCYPGLRLGSIDPPVCFYDLGSNLLDTMDSIASNLLGLSEQIGSLSKLSFLSFASNSCCLPFTEPLD